MQLKTGFILAQGLRQDTVHSGRDITAAGMRNGSVAGWQPEPEATSDFTSTVRKQELDQK